MDKCIENGIKNIVFDLGQVLLRYDWEGYLHRLGYEGEMFEILADAVFRNPDWETGDVGCVTPEEWEQLFIKNGPEYEEDIKKVFSGIGETISKFSYTDPWVKYLYEKGYRLYFLSNYSEKLHQDTVQHMDFMKMFIGGIFSYEVKCIKPDLKIYQLLLEKYKLCPEETLFFDDREVNVLAARKLGIQAKIFTSDVACDMLQMVEIISA